MAFLYFVLPKKNQPYLLLIANIIFYCCADVKYLVFLAGCIATTFLAAILMKNKKEIRVKDAILAATIFLNIGTLITVKYSGYIPL